MKSFGKIPIYSMVLVVMIITMDPIQVKSSLHRVGGGRYNWKPDVNFSDWASHEIFYAGDWLYFGFDRTKYNVLQVNQTAYDQCIETNFISNVTKGGRDVFQLVEPKPYFFICGRGYCSVGMKLAVDVLPPPPPPATPLTPATPTSSAGNSASNTAAAAAALAFPLLSVLSA